MAAKLKLANIYVFVQGTNLLLLTAYNGVDPEASSNGNSNLTPSVDKNPVDLGRTVTFGLNIRM